jgi:hypothetical protein
MAVTGDFHPTLRVGTEVEVFSRFRHAWVGGFEVRAVHEGRYSLWRHLDRAVIPGTFDADDLRIRRIPSA